MKTLIVFLFAAASLATAFAQAPGLVPRKVSIPQPKVFIFKKKTTKFFKNF